MTEHYELVVRAASALIDGEFRPAQLGVLAGQIARISEGDLDGDTVITLAEDEVPQVRGHAVSPKRG